MITAMMDCCGKSPLPPIFPGVQSPILEGHSYRCEGDMVTVETNANAAWSMASMTYDPLHRLASRTYPDSGVEHFGYTANIPGMTSYTNPIDQCLDLRL